MALSASVTAVLNLPGTRPIRRLRNVQDPVGKPAGSWIFYREILLVSAVSSLISCGASGRPNGVKIPPWPQRGKPWYDSRKNLAGTCSIVLAHRMVMFLADMDSGFHVEFAAQRNYVTANRLAIQGATSAGSCTASLCNCPTSYSLWRSLRASRILICSRSASLFAFDPPIAWSIG